MRVKACESSRASCPLGVLRIVAKILPGCLRAHRVSCLHSYMTSGRGLERELNRLNRATSEESKAEWVFEVLSPDVAAVARDQDTCHPEVLNNQSFLFMCK